MTIQEKLIRNKLSLLELAAYLKNVSEACKINGVSRQHFYDIKKTYDEEGLEGLRKKSRRKPFFEQQSIPALRVLTDRGTEFCGLPDKHPYELYLQLNEIDHTKTTVRSPQTNGIC